MTHSSYQTKISRKLRNLKKKLIDNKIDKIGIDLELFVLSITNNKYEDEDTIELKGTKKIIGYINYPGEEIPLTNKFSNNSSTQGFHLYDLLPIEFFCKFEDRVNLGDIIIHKFLLPDDSIKAMFLQVVDHLGRIDTDVVFMKYILAPYTFDLNNSENMEIKNVVEDYLKEPLIALPDKKITNPYGDED